MLKKFKKAPKNKGQDDNENFYLEFLSPKPALTALSNI